MSRGELAVVTTGSANLASVVAAFRRLGERCVLTGDPGLVLGAARVVLPGVGAFGAVMNRLNERGLADALRERIAVGRPLLAICLGTQLLAVASDESPGSAGLGVLRARVTRLPAPVRVPQLGWNRVVPSRHGAYVSEKGYAYFANSYCLTEVPRDWVAAHAVYGERFVAAAERGSQLACQFHPELSGAWGARLLARWLSKC